LCDKLDKEGLFAPERKKLLPPYPRRVALVTSAQTAALQDMLKVLRRFPWLKLFLYHVPVQGDGAGKEIAAALRALDRYHPSVGGIDVILLARGGGSLEDLWAFNEEAVARAVAASRVPVVTGIGHEIDTSIADLVADYHAHTPTEAAQVVVQNWRLAADGIGAAGARLRRGLRQMAQDGRQRLTAIERHETFRRPLFRVYMFRQLMDDREKALALMVSERVRAVRRRLQEIADRVDRHHPSLLIANLRNRLRSHEQRLEGAVRARLRSDGEAVGSAATRLAERHPRHRVRLLNQHLVDVGARFARAGADDLRRRAQRLAALASHLAAVGPEQVLRRGFSLTVRKKDGQIIRSVSQVKPGDRMITRFADGQIEWTAEDPRQLSLFH
jgi:exodeoxyribonuclease VII large subunit